LRGRACAHLTPRVLSVPPEARARFPPHQLGSPARLGDGLKDLGAGEVRRYILRVPDSAREAAAIPQLRCGIVLRVEEDVCQVLTEGQVVSVRYAPHFPAPRTERVSPGHLVAIAEVPGGSGVVLWRWYDAVVLGNEAGSVRLWEPAHGEVVAQRRDPQQRHDPGTRAYLSAGLPGAKWWVAGKVVARAEDADVELSEVERLYTEHGLWDSVLGA